MIDHSVNANNMVPLILYTGLMAIDGAGVVPLVWSKEKPTQEAYFWYRNDAMSESVVQVYQHIDEGMHMLGPEVDHCKIDDLDGDEEWSGSEWAGPIALPGPEPTMAAQHFYRVEDVEALILEMRQSEVDGLKNMHYIDACDAILDRLRGGA